MVSPELLRRYPFFAGLDEPFLKELAMCSDEIVLADGVWLFHEGDEADALYLILRGMVDLKARLPHHEYADVEQVIEGEIVGWSAVCEPTFYKLSAATPAGVRLLRVDGRRLRELLADRPEMGYLLMRHLTNIIGKRLNSLRTRFVSVSAV